MLRNLDSYHGFRPKVDYKKDQEVVDLRKSAGIRKRPKEEFLSPAAKIHSTFSKKPAKRKSSALLLFLIILLVLLVAAAAASFFIFNKSGISGNSLKLTLSAPKTAVSGKEITLEVGYQNLDKVPLKKLELVLNYPDSFFFNSATQDPYNKENNIWSLADLPVGGSGNLKIKGQLVGKIDEEKEFSVVFRYQPANFNSDFRENLTSKVNIKDVLLDVAVMAPEKIESGQPAELKVNYENKSDADFSNLYLAFDLGEAFAPLGVASSTAAYQWQLEKLAVGEKGEITVSGKIDPIKSNPFFWDFRIWQVVEQNGEKQQRVLYQQNGQIELMAPDLAVKLELDSPEQKINWGETVNYKISYKNNGQLDVKEVVLRMAFNTAIDWAKYQNATSATIDEKNNTLIWLSKSSEAAKGLALLPIGAEGELKVSVPLKQPGAELDYLSPEELIIDAVASLTVKFHEEQKVFASEHLISAVASQPKLNAEARYYLDAKTMVGSGPLPPKIGEETKYRIYWKLFTGSNGLTKVAVKTTLPNYINFVGPAGDPTLGAPLKFNNSSRQVIWEIEAAGPNSNLMAVFDVAVTPVESQVNQLFILTNSATVTAQEKETQNLVSKTSGLLTSDLVTDPVAKGKGRVMVK